MALGALLLRGGVAWADPKIAAPDGIPVTFTSTRQDTAVFIAKGDQPEGSDVYIFERLGVAPLTVKLAPGLYTVEAQGAASSLGYTKFHLDAMPLTIQVRPGDELVKVTGVLLEGLGVVSVVLGILAAVSFSGNDTGYPRWAISLPLLLGGAGTFGLGYGLVLIGATRIELPKGGAQAVGAGVMVRF